MSIGHHPTQSQHTPDMRKKDEDITESDMAEAKRRIEGSISGPSIGNVLPSRAPTANFAG
jgi:phosphatidylserine decarboxylase